MAISEQQQRVLNEGLEVLMGRRGAADQKALRLADLDALGLTSLAQGRRSGLLASTATIDDVTALQGSISGLSGLVSQIQTDLNAAEAALLLAQEDATQALADAAAVQVNLDAESLALTGAITTQVGIVDARVTDAFDAIDAEVNARIGAVAGLTGRADDADLALTLEEQARLLGDATIGLRVDQVELAVNSDNLIRTATGNNGVGNWQNATVNADIPAAASPGSESIEIDTTLSVETATGGGYYQGAVRDRAHNVTGWVRFIGGGGRFAMIGSTAGNGPGGTTILAQGDPIAAGGWVALDQHLTVTQDIDQWAPGWVLDAGASVRFFNLRLRDTTTENSILASVASTYETQLSATGARAALGNTLRAEFAAADTAAAATAATTYATITNTDLAIAQAETDLTAAFQQADTAVLATVATEYVALAGLTTAISQLETSLQAEIASGDADTTAFVTSGYVANAALDSAIAAVRTSLEAKIRTSSMVMTPVGDAGDASVSGWSSFAGTTITSTDLPPGYTTGRSIQIYGRAWEIPPILGNLNGRRIRYRGWIKAVAGSARLSLRYVTPSGSSNRVMLGPEVLPASGWTLIEGVADVGAIETTEYRPDIFSPNQSSPTNVIRFHALEIEDATAAREAQAYADQTFLTDVTQDAAFASLQSLVGADTTGLVDRLGQVEATYLSEAEAENTYLAQTDAQSAEAAQTALLQAQFTTGNEIIKPNATGGVGGWTGAVTASTDVPAGSPSGARSLRVQGIAYEAPERFQQLLGRKKRMTGWIKAIAGVAVKIGIYARRASDGVLVHIPGETIAITVGSWTQFSTVTEIAIGTSGWFPLLHDGTGAVPDVLFYDVRIEDITETANTFQTAQAQIEDIRAVSGTAAGSALATTLQTLTSEVITGGGSTLKAQVVQQATTLADQDGFLQAFAGVTVETGPGGAIAGFRATSFADPTGAGGGTLELLGDVIVPGTLAAESLTIGLGRNLISTIFPAVHGLDGWQFAGAPANTVFQVNGTGEQWSHPTEGSFELFQNNGATNTPSWADWRGLSASTGTLALGYPVAPGEWVEFSARLSAHRCTARVEISFRDATGAQIGLATGNSNVSNASSSTNLRQWPISSVVAQAPAGTVYAVPRVWKGATTSGQANSYLFFAHPMFAITLEGRQPTPFSAPASTYIGPQGIATNAITADKITAETVRAKVASFVNLSTVGLVANRASIETAAINTLLLDGNAATVPVSQTVTNPFTGNDDYQEIQWINYDPGITTLTYILFSAQQSYTAVGSLPHEFQIRINGSVVTGRGGTVTNDYPNLTWSGTITAGVKRISIYWIAGTSIRVLARNLSILAAKR